MSTPLFRFSDIFCFHFLPFASRLQKNGGSLDFLRSIFAWNEDLAKEIKLLNGEPISSLQGATTAFSSLEKIMRALDSQKKFPVIYIIEQWKGFNEIIANAQVLLRDCSIFSLSLSSYPNISISLAVGFLSLCN